MLESAELLGRTAEEERQMSHVVMGLIQAIRAIGRLSG